MINSPETKQLFDQQLAEAKTASLVKLEGKYRKEMRRHEQVMRSLVEDKKKIEEAEILEDLVDPCTGSVPRLSMSGGIEVSRCLEF